MAWTRPATAAENRAYEAKIARLKAQDKKDGGHRAQDFINEEHRKFKEIQAQERREKAEARRRKMLGGSGGKR